MKTPRFEEMAKRWAGKAQFFIVYSKEAHPGAKGAGPLGRAADELMKKDVNGDNQVSFEEFAGPKKFFEPFDVNNDGVVNAHELLAARKIEQFADVAEPETLAEREELARRYREECPGQIPVLIDDLDDAVATAYGRRPNSAFVIGKEGRVRHQFGWANERDIELALVELVGEQSPAVPAAKAPDWSPIRSQLDAASEKGRAVLVEFTAPGCGACEAMEESTLSDPGVREKMGGYEFARVGVEDDAVWALFEALELTGTPAFVVIDPGPKVRTRLQGFVDTTTFARFLSG